MGLLAVLAVAGYGTLVNAQVVTNVVDNEYESATNIVSKPGARTFTVGATPYLSAQLQHRSQCSLLDAGVRHALF
jgi:hypothetical protein